jgi:hypothetical protein
MTSLESFGKPDYNWNFSQRDLNSAHGFDVGQCSVGNYQMAIAYLARWSGPLPESDTEPIRGGYNTQKHIQQVILLPPRRDSLDNNTIKSFISTYGAVYASYYYQPSFMDTTERHYYNNANTNTNLSVAVVGWDDNLSASNFGFLQQPPGDGAFLVKDSGSFISSEYFWISYYDTSFIPRASFNNADEPDNYDTIYQYDLLGHTSNSGYGSTIAWGANIFRSESRSTVKAVSFYTNDVNTKYKILIFKDIEPGLPTSGSLLEIKRGSQIYPGYYTEVLDSPVLLNKDDLFSVVIKFNNSSYPYPVPIEKPLDGYSSDAKSNIGESFISSDGTQWTDLYDTNGNVCIKAFTVNSVKAASITVTAPNGGENWDVGSTYEIKWTSQELTGNVQIDYSTNSGVTWKTITESTEDDGSYNWNVPHDPSDNCLVCISEADDDEGARDTSDTEFSIVNPFPGSLTLRSPNGGEEWIAGLLQEIKWKSTGDISSITLKYSIDTGNTWKPIVQNFTNNGSYQWLVPDTISDKCLVQIMASGSDLDPKPSDVSDAVFSIVLPPTPAIRIVYPNGGEQLTVNKPCQITWTSAYIGGEVKIEYSANGGNTWSLITAAAENKGKYDWLVPDAPSDNCLVRVSEANGSVEDVSDAVFSIVQQLLDDLTVTSPNGGESWDVGSLKQITWESTGGINNVKLEFSADGGKTWKVIVASTENDGSYEVTVPNRVSEECLVRVTANDGDPDPVPSDVSDDVFSIVLQAGPSIKVLTPNGGEQLVVGSQCLITWESINIRDDIKLEYSTDGGDTWLVITDATENNGKFNWTIPDEPSEICLVRISDTGGPAVDISDAVFSIIPPLLPEVTVTSPNGGESWVAGSLNEIKWSTTGDINNVSIQYSTDRGNTWEPITSNTPNDGSHDWTIPNTPSDTCLVRVAANDDDVDPIPSDISDQVFSIVEPSPTLRVISPNGGESWEVGSTQIITWTGIGNITKVSIEYTFDNGNNWNTIASAVNNTGSYDWQVPDSVSDECLVQITANDGDQDPKPSDVSDEVFSIVLPTTPTVRVITPNGGEQLIIGSTYQITWFSSNPREPKKIEYSTDGGDSWKEIIGSTGDGGYNWQVPDEPSDFCLVRISETNGQAQDISDSVFSIVSPPPHDLTVLTPNGGETLEVGTDYNITWTCSGLNNVIIEYSVNNGATWLYIDKVPADNGSYNWNVPGTPSDDCLVRISGADSDENPYDVSNGIFTIFDPSQTFIEVISPNGGESLTVGNEYYITWTSAGIMNVKIEYSINNGESWTPIIDTLPAKGGRYTWIVPGTSSVDCLVRISDTAGPALDVSDSVFSITQI